MTKTLQQIVDIGEAISHPVRLKLLYMLSENRRCNAETGWYWKTGPSQTKKTGDFWADFFFVNELVCFQRDNFGLTHDKIPCK